MTDGVVGAELLAGTGTLDAGPGFVLAGEDAGATLDWMAGSAAVEAPAGDAAFDVAGAGGDVPDCAGAGCAGAFGTVFEIVVITG